MPRILESLRRFVSMASSHARSSILMPLFLAGFAFVYYSLYVDAGLNLGGEGGTAAMIAMRLNAGQLPMLDVYLGGYNVMWYLPVAGLFEWTGPNYLILRWYFFTFCIASGLLVYFVVFGYTRNAWFSAVPALLAILIPGMIFRNYLPFLGVLNAFLLTRAFVMRRSSWRKSLAWMAGAGAGLGLTFLFRIELAVFFSVIFFGLAILYPLGERGQFLQRIAIAASGVILGLFFVLALHWPFWNDAKTRGYDRGFLGQYSECPLMLWSEFRQHVFPKKPNSSPSQEARNVKRALPVQNKPSSETWEDRGALSRASLSEMWHAKDWSRQSLALSTYLPIVISTLSIFVGSILLLIALVRRDSEAKERILYPLTVLGCALTLFPQYFFFRPDTPHISEMMVPYFAALATLIWAAWSFSSRGRSLPVRLFARGLIFLYLFTATIYFSHAFPKTSAGTIAARKKASHKFDALNGVHVKVRRDDALRLAGIRDAILRHSHPQEYVVCYPYQPTINFMTDRPSPLHNMYVDNATGVKRFTKDFFQTVAVSNPAIFVVDQRDINRTEASRFRNWAPEVYRWLHDHYAFIGRYGRIEVFARTDKVKSPVAAEFIEAED